MAAAVGLVVIGLIRWQGVSRRRAEQAAALQARQQRAVEWDRRARALADDIDSILATAPALAPGPVTDAALRHQTGLIDSGLAALSELQLTERDHVARRAATALRSWATAFEAASLLHRSAAPLTPGQLDTADGLVVARTNELRAAVLGLREPDEPVPPSGDH